MRTTFLAIILLLAQGTLAVAQTAEPTLSPVTQTAPGDISDTIETAAEEKKHDGMTIFLIVFTVAVLFVLSTATALNRLGGKRPPPSPRQPREPRPSAKTPSKLPEGKERFRL